MIHDTQSAQISQKQDECNLYAIMKTMCSPVIHHHNGFMATHALHLDDVWLHISGTNEPKSAQQATQGA